MAASNSLVDLHAYREKLAKMLNDADQETTFRSFQTLYHEDPEFVDIFADWAAVICRTDDDTIPMQIPQGLWLFFENLQVQCPELVNFLKYITDLRLHSMEWLHYSQPQVVETFALNELGHLRDFVGSYIHGLSPGLYEKIVESVPIQVEHELRAFLYKCYEMQYFTESSYPKYLCSIEKDHTIDKLREMLTGF